MIVYALCTVAGLAAGTLGGLVLATCYANSKIVRLRAQVDMLRIHKRIAAPLLGESVSLVPGDTLTITHPTFGVVAAYSATSPCFLERTA